MPNPNLAKKAPQGEKLAKNGPRGEKLSIFK